MDIQGLRAIAVALVIVEHTRWGLTGGFTGVDVFFVISGFVIAGSLLRGLSREGKVGFKEFYKRRVFRLMPAATLVILVTAVVSSLLVSPLGLQQQAAVTGGAALVWAANIALYYFSSDYFSPHVQANPYLHTWSLGVEEQFYLVVPVVLALSWAAGRKLRRDPVKVLFAVVALLGVASFMLSLATSTGSTLGVFRNPAQFAFYMMPTRAWEFAVGMLLALALHRRSHSLAHATAAGAMSAAGVALIGIGAVVITNAMHFPGYAALLPVAGTALAILGGMRGSAVASMLGSPLMVWLGDRSYSLYLWHWPLIVFARRIWPDSAPAMIGAVVAALILADLTFRFVEEPLMRRGYQPLRWRSALLPAGAFVAAGLSCLALLVGSMTGWHIPQLKATTAQLNERPLGYHACLSTTLVSERDLSPCTWGAERPGEPIYLMGDSNAQQYTEAVVGAAEQLDRPLIVATWGGCPFVDARRHELNDPTKGEECARYVKDGTDWLLAQPKGTVLLADAGVAINSDTITLEGESDPQAKQRVWAESLEEQLRTLQAGGHTPVSISVAPHFPDPVRGWWHPADCGNSDLLNAPASCAAELTTSQLDEQRSLTLEAERQAIRSTGAQSIDPAPQLCGSGCSTFRDDLWVYRDGLHITPEQSRRLVELFTTALSA